MAPQLGKRSLPVNLNPFSPEDRALYCLQSTVPSFRILDNGIPDNCFTKYQDTVVDKLRNQIDTSVARQFSYKLGSRLYYNEYRILVTLHHVRSLSHILQSLYTSPVIMKYCHLIQNPGSDAEAWMPRGSGNDFFGCSWCFFKQSDLSLKDVLETVLRVYPLLLFLTCSLGETLSTESESKYRGL